MAAVDLFGMGMGFGKGCEMELMDLEDLEWLTLLE
jgi:hypothetical protein